MNKQYSVISFQYSVGGSLASSIECATKPIEHWLPKTEYWILNTEH